MNYFFKEIASGKLMPPTSPKFSIKKWNEALEQSVSEGIKEGGNIYHFGMALNETLKVIRGNLFSLFEKAPEINYEQLLLGLVALSNREITVAMRRAGSMKSDSIYNVMLMSDASGELLNIQEIAHGVIDGFQIAILDCIRCLESGKTITASEEPVPVIDFIKYEAALSQLYSVYEHLWQCVFWSNYDINLIDAEKKVYEIKQPNTEFERCFLRSVNRKEKLSAHKVISAQSLMRHFDDDWYILTKRSGNKRIFLASRTKSASENLRFSNAIWNISKSEIYQTFPQAWFHQDYGFGFCIDEILRVFQQLMLLSLTISDKYPSDDSAYKYNKLMEFCIQLPSANLKPTLMLVTGYDEGKIDLILDFLTISKDKNDLWCHPLIKTSQGKYTLLAGALNTPSMLRLVEHWLVTFKVDLSEKGYEFERNTIEKLNKVLVNNSLIEDFDNAIGKRFKLKTGEEEIDLLLRIGNVIIVGELKAIVTTDSEISKYRTSETLTKAGIQIARKAKFISDNLQEVSDILGWAFDDFKSCKIIKIIVSSNGVFAGYRFNNVPVIDSLILNTYFKDPIVRLITKSESDGSLKNIAWYELYDSQKQLMENFEVYIDNPPQLNMIDDDVDYKCVRFPSVDNQDCFFCKSRFFMPNLTADLVVNRKTPFKLVKSDDYDLQVNAMDVIF